MGAGNILTGMFILIITNLIFKRTTHHGCIQRAVVKKTSTGHHNAKLK